MSEPAGVWYLKKKCKKKKKSDVREADKKINQYDANRCKLLSVR